MSEFRWNWVGSLLEAKSQEWVADLLQGKRKGVFVWLHGFVTWENETKGLGQVQDCVLDEGCDGNCTLDQTEAKNRALSVPVCRTRT